MEDRYRNFYAKAMLSSLGLSEQCRPKSALIVRGGVQLGQSYNKRLSNIHETSPIFESLQEYYSGKALWESSAESILFCSYFPSLEEFIALSSTNIRTVYYMGDVTDEKTVRFLNGESGQDFKIIKLEMV